MKTLFLAIATFFSIACLNAQKANSLQDIKQLSFFPKDEKQKAIHKEKLHQTAEVLTNLITNESVREMILNSIKTGYYSDESILFQDLFNGQESKAMRDVKVTDFEGLFDKASAEQKVEGEDMKSFLVKNRIQVYFPYSDNFWKEELTTITISFHPIDSDEKNEGYVISLKEGSRQETTVVTDEYAQKNPVLIVNYNEGDEGGNNENSSPIPQKDEAVECEYPTQAVYIGEFKFFHQWDGIFAGGPDFYFYRGEPVYSIGTNGGGQLNGVNKGFLVNPKRNQKKEWVKTNTLWDDKWSPDKTMQHLGVYEDDPDSGSSFDVTGSVGYTLPTSTVVNGNTTTTGATLGPNLSATYSYKISSADDLIFHNDLDRCRFFKNNQKASLIGLQSGWRIHGNGTELIWTMPNED